MLNAPSLHYSSGDVAMLLMIDILYQHLGMVYLELSVHITSHHTSGMGIERGAKLQC